MSTARARPRPCAPGPDRGALACAARDGQQGRAPRSPAVFLEGGRAGLSLVAVGARGPGRPEGVAPVTRRAEWRQRRNGGGGTVRAGDPGGALRGKVTSGHATSRSVRGASWSRGRLCRPCFRRASSSRRALDITELCHPGLRAWLCSCGFVCGPERTAWWAAATARNGAAAVVVLSARSGSRACASGAHDDPGAAVTRPAGLRSRIEALGRGPMANEADRSLATALEARHHAAPPPPPRPPLDVRAVGAVVDVLWRSMRRAGRSGLDWYWGGVPSAWCCDAYPRSCARQAGAADLGP
jgi:hypothetical protein